MRGSGTGSDDDANAQTVAASAITIAADRISRPSIDHLLPGSQVGRYRLKARLGEGAMGVVWSAHDPKLDRDVALKLVHAELASDEASNRLMREAKAMAKLSHRSVITVYDVDEVDHQLFIAMELVRGTTLGSMLRARDAEAIADWPRWLAIMIAAGQGLAAAHRSGVLHRDFKPDNVLVDANGRVCVGDFGLALLGETLSNQSRQWTAVRAPSSFDDSATSLDLTTTGALLGTPVYMGPQQLRGEAIDARADQFAFCVATWEALYGTRPFVVLERGLEAVVALINAIEQGPPPVGDSPVPEQVRAVLACGLAVDPAARWPDMDTLIAELEQGSAKPHVAPLVVTIKPTAAPRPPRRWPIAVAFAVVAVALATVVFWVRGRAETPSNPPPGQPKLTRLFGTPLNTKTAISPSGKKMALGGDVVEVRNLDGTWSKSLTLPIGIYGVLYLEIDDQEIRFTLDRPNKRWRWRFNEESTAVIEDMQLSGGLWAGTTLAGELIRVEDKGLALLRDGKIERWGPRIEIKAISPDRRRVAYVEGGRFNGHIVVRDVTTGQTTQSEMLEEPTSVAWFDNTTLLYATSTLVQPRISRVKVDSAFGKPEVIYASETGWFSDLAVGAGKLYVVSMPPSPRGRVIKRGPSARRSELDSVSLGMAWDAQDRVVTWNASNRKVGPSNAGEPQLATEPVSATMAGDVLIAALRDRGGRNAVAVSLADGKPVWKSPDKRTLVVRCAGDRTPPCFAIHNPRENLDRIVGIDHLTGTLSATVLYEATKIEDFAVRADGKQLIVSGISELIEIDSSGVILERYNIPNAKEGAGMNVVRSVAYDPSGGFLVAGTIGRNTYQVGRLWNNRYEPLDDARDKILSFVRPSSDGARVVFIARGYEPELFRLEF